MVETSPKQGLPCPVCKIDLVMSERQGVEIDYCPQCRGVWLDWGELDKIIERSDTEDSPRAPVDPSLDYKRGDHGGRGHGGQGRHRRRGFLSDLFD